MNARQRFFVLEYLIDLDPEHAAIRAGYAPRNARSQGSALLRRPEIASAIRDAMDERARRTGITAERVLEEYARVVLAIGCLLADDETAGDPVAESEKFSPDPCAALALLSQLSGEGRREIVAGLDEQKLLESLARLFGLNLIEPKAGAAHRA